MAVVQVTINFLNQVMMVVVVVTLNEKRICGSQAVQTAKALGTMQIPATTMLALSIST